MAILQHIQSMSDQLAESEAKVAKVILAEPELLEHATITLLAHRADTSTSAVLRFCHTLGFAGFKDFRYELVAEIQRDAGRGEQNDRLRNAAEGLAEAIRRLADLDRTPLTELAAQIARARQVFCIGTHRSFLPAEKLRMDLTDLGIVAISCRDSVEATHLCGIVDERSCLLIFSETGSLANYRAALDGGLVALGSAWLITSNARAQLAAHVPHTIVLPSAKRAGAAGVDEHPVALAFAELLALLVQEELS